MIKSIDDYPEFFREPGIYLDLPEEEYFKDRGIGGTGVKVFSQETGEWWWNSDFNTFKPDLPENTKRSAALNFGKALHKCILEGLAAYEAEYTVEFNPDQFPEAIEGASALKEIVEAYNEANIDPDALSSASEISDRLHELGLKKTGKKDDLIKRLIEADPNANIATFKPLPVSGSIEELTERVLEIAPDTELMETHRRAYEEKVGDKIPISEFWDNSIKVMRRIVDHDPEVRKMLADGIPEVSVFWRENGVPCRARFDWLRICSSVDLKSFSVKTGTPIFQAIMRNIQNYRYDLQEAHYKAARRAMKGLPIHGGTPEQQDYIRKCADNPDAPFKFLFYKSIGAPVLRRTELPEKASLLAAEERERAFEEWRTFYKEYGFDTPWITESKEMEIYDTDFWASFGVG